MQKIFGLIALVAVSAILAISIILQPDKISSWVFWSQLGWLIFLVVLNLLVSGAFFSSGDLENKHSKRSIGILPALNILVFIYSLISAALLLFNIYLDSSFISSYHLVLQIAFAAFFMITGLFVYLTSKGAEVDLPGDKRREDLLHDLKSLGVDMNLSDNQSFLDLVEQIKYKMPHPSSIDKDSYLEIVKDIEGLSKSHSDEIIRKLNNIQRKIKKVG